MVMRDTIFCAIGVDANRAEITASVHRMAAEVASYVPGYRLLQEPQFADPSELNGDLARVSIFVEVEGAGDFLPPYASNLDIMTAAASGSTVQPGMRSRCANTSPRRTPEDCGVAISGSADWLCPA